MDYLIPSLIVNAATGLSLFALYSVVTRSERLQPGTVDSFDCPPAIDSSAETIASEQTTTQAKRSDTQPWHVKMLNSLSDVTDLLDCLEMHGIHQRKVEIINDNTFAVRWR